MAWKSGLLYRLAGGLILVKLCSAHLHSAIIEFKILDACFLETVNYDVQTFKLINYCLFDIWIIKRVEFVNFSSCHFISTHFCSSACTINRCCLLTLYAVCNIFLVKWTFYLYVIVFTLTGLLLQILWSNISLWPEELLLLISFTIHKTIYFIINKGKRYTIIEGCSGQISG